MTVQGQSFVQGLCRVLCRVKNPAIIGLCRVCRGQANAGAPARESSALITRLRCLAPAYAPLHTLHTLHKPSVARVCAVQGRDTYPAHPAQAGSRSRADAQFPFPIALKGGRGGEA